MRAALFVGPHHIDVGDRPDAAIAEPTDAVVRLVLACVCGSDLWYYRGDSPFEPGPIGHEFIGAERIIALSRHADRQALAREFGATDVVDQRGDEATAADMELTGGVGADATLECVGTGLAMETALSIARPGSMVGYVGVPHGVELPIGEMFLRNKGVRGGSAPARAYIPELLEDVLEDRINPGRVLDYATDLDGIADAYAAMDERRAIKSLVRVGAL